MAMLGYRRSAEALQGAQESSEISASTEATTRCIAALCGLHVDSAAALRSHLKLALQFPSESDMADSEVDDTENLAHKIWSHELCIAQLKGALEVERSRCTTQTELATLQVSTLTNRDAGKNDEFNSFVNPIASTLDRPGKRVMATLGWMLAPRAMEADKKGAKEGIAAVLATTFPCGARQNGAQHMLEAMKTVLTSIQEQTLSDDDRMIFGKLHDRYMCCQLGLGVLAPATETVQRFGSGRCTTCLSSSLNSLPSYALALFSQSLS